MTILLRGRDQGSCAARLCETEGSRMFIRSGSCAALHWASGLSRRVV